MIIAKKENNIVIQNGTSLINLIKQTYPQSLPELEVFDTSPKNYTEIRTSGRVVDSGGSAIVDRGIVYNLTGEPTILDTSIVDDHNFNTGEWPCLISGLEIDTTYYIRSFGVNSTGINYSPDASATTYGGIDPPQTETITATNVRYTDMSFSGESIYNGGSFINENGIIVSEDPDPTEINGVVIPSIVTGVGNYTVYWGDYGNQTIYYYKAYAKNDAGTGYGDIQTITSPLRTISEITYYGGFIFDINIPSYHMQGRMDSIGDDSVSSYGYLLSLSPGVSYPSDVITDEGVWDYSVDGEYGSYPAEYRAVGNEYDVSYYGNVYAINDYGVALGVEQSYMLNSQIPQLNCDDLINVTHSTADVSSAHITWDGGAEITERGILWRQSGGWGPTLDDCDVSIAIPGTETDYKGYITGLIQNTFIFSGAYAINKNGAGYGYATSVITPAYVPATLGLSTSYHGGFHHIFNQFWVDEGEGVGPITEYGVVYSTSPNPTTSDTQAPLSGYEARLAGLPYRLSPPNELTYYMRAYIINSEGTTYSNEVAEQTWFGKGLSYNFFMTQNPDFTPNDDWIVPSRADFSVLSSYLSTNGLTGGDLKTVGVGTQTWEDENIGATNSTGFSGLGTGGYNTNQPGDTVSWYWSHQALYMYTSDSFGINSPTPYLRVLWNDSTSFSQVYQYTSGGYILPNDGYAIRLVYTGTGSPTSLTDIDGNVYPVVQIGTQYWLAENYRVKTLRTGVAIPNLTDDAAWKATTDGAWREFPDQYF